MIVSNSWINLTLNYSDSKEENSFSCCTTSTACNRGENGSQQNHVDVASQVQTSVLTLVAKAAVSSTCFCAWFWYIFCFYAATWAKYVTLEQINVTATITRTDKEETPEEMICTVDVQRFWKTIPLKGCITRFAVHIVLPWNFGRGVCQRNVTEGLLKALHRLGCWFNTVQL